MDYHDRKQNQLIDLGSRQEVGIETPISVDSTVDLADPEIRVAVIEYATILLEIAGIDQLPPTMER